MQVWQLLERVRRNVKFDDRYQIVDLLNDALNQLTEGAKLEGSQSLTFSSVDGSVILPDTFKAPIALIDGQISAPNAIYPLVNIEEQKYGYSLFSGKAYLKPKPDQDKTLTLYFYKYSTNLVNDEDIPEIDEAYHDLLSSYASLMLLMNTGGDKGLIDRLTAQWNQGLSGFKQSMLLKNKRSGVNVKVMW